MPPKRTKAEEALAFLDNLDNLETPADDAQAAPAPAGVTAVKSESGSRKSTDSTRSRVGKADAGRASTEIKRTGTPGTDGKQEATGAAAGAGGSKADEEAAQALEYLEAQIKTKRAPLSAPKTTTPRTSTPSTTANVESSVPAAQTTEANVPTAPAASSGWGVGSFWSTATSAIQSAQKIADEGYKRVRTEGVTGVAGGLEGLRDRAAGVAGGVSGVTGVDLDKLRKGAEERLGGIVKGVDLEKLRQDLLNTTSSTFTTILNTVAPPISAHETLELWLSHPMVGYSGVEGVIYRAWVKILEQTESGELVIVWSPETPDQEDKERGINPIEGWEKGWSRQTEQMDGVKKREEENPQGRGKQNPNVPVTTVPIFLHLQPLLAPLPIPEPSLLLSTSDNQGKNPTGSSVPLHLYFLLTLHDPTHSLRFTTVTQPSPADWLDVEYERSDWVEERLVEVLRTSVEVIAQDYVATRMGLKPSSITRPASPSTQPQAVPESSEEKATA